jgi:hypothetical protein
MVENVKSEPTMKYASIVLAVEPPRVQALEPMNLTAELRHALIACPGETGAFGATWPSFALANDQATEFCRLSPSHVVASAQGVFRARVYELPGDRWAVAVWYAALAGATV